VRPPLGWPRELDLLYEANWLAGTPTPFAWSCSPVAGSGGACDETIFRRSDLASGLYGYASGGFGDRVDAVQGQPEKGFVVGSAIVAWLLV
jgi:hypothetical protein